MVKAVSPENIENQLMDPFGREISYLRLSVTDRCDFRCVYCMSEHTQFLPRKDILTLEEMDKVATAFINRGVKKLRITGGEPLVRRGVMAFFDSVSRHLRTGALSELTLTTNGTQLDRFADQLADVGVERVNVSLDTLNDEKFTRVTRWGAPEPGIGRYRGRQESGASRQDQHRRVEGIQLR